MYCFELSEKDPRVVGIVHNDSLYQVEENDRQGWHTKRYKIFRVKTSNPNNRAMTWTNHEVVAEANSVMEAKQIIAKQPQHNAEKRCEPIAKLAGTMLSCIDWKDVWKVMVPDAGKGELIDAMSRLMDDNRYKESFSAPYSLKDNVAMCCDVTDEDAGNREILKEMGANVVGDDFNRFCTEARYDLLLWIGDSFFEAHHALNLMKNSGQVVLAMPARIFLQNPAPIAIIELRVRFRQYGSVSFVKANGENYVIAYMNVQQRHNQSEIFIDALERANNDFVARGRTGFSPSVEQMMVDFDAEVKAGVKFIETFYDLAPHIMEDTSYFPRPLIGIGVGDHIHRDNESDLVNSWVKKVRAKYWRRFFQDASFQGEMTSVMNQIYAEKIKELEGCDLNSFHINNVMDELKVKLAEGAEQSILDTFNVLSNKRYRDSKSTTEYVGMNGKTAWKLNQKVTISLCGFSSYSYPEGQLNEYDTVTDLKDIETSLRYLDQGEVGFRWSIVGAIQTANKMKKTEIDLAYFGAKFFKKGTTRITFNEAALPILERLNIYAGIKNGWLPECYGKKAYADMTDEEKSVIDAFQGKEAYDKVFANPGKYIFDIKAMKL